MSHAAPPDGRTRSLCAAALSCLCVGARANDWLQFGYDPAHSGANPEATGIAANVGRLELQYATRLPAFSDSPPVFLEHVATPAGERNLLFVTTFYGQLVAIDADSGQQLWVRQPAAGPALDTESGPVVDPDRKYVYSPGLGGKVHKYRVEDGSEVVDGAWPETVTLKPDQDKISSALSFATSADGTTYLYATTSNFGDDLGDYQGHVTAIDLATGQQAVFNTLCSDVTTFLTAAPEGDCADVQSGVWGRPGVTYDAGNDRLYFATGNGPYDANQGGHDWAESVLAFTPSLRDANGAPMTTPLDSYTPAEQETLTTYDWDLGVQAPSIVPAPPGSNTDHLAVQIGKDGLLRLLDLDNLSRRSGPGHVGGEISVTTGLDFRGNGNAQPAVWTEPATGKTWIFAAYERAEHAFVLSVNGAGKPILLSAWTRAAPWGATSPVVADGVVFIAEGSKTLVALDATTGTQLWSTLISGVHWSSPIVVDGAVYLVNDDGTLRAYAPSRSPIPAQQAAPPPVPKSRRPAVAPLAPLPEREPGIVALAHQQRP